MISFWQQPADSSGVLGTLWESAWEIWSKGGWAMIAIALVALLLFCMGVHVQLRLWSKRYRSVSDKTWRLWIEHPKYREGRIGRLLDTVTRASTIDESAAAFEQVRHSELAPINRDLRVMKVCIAAAPLLGLLGTVTGMLSTFDALASGSGGDKTMAAISRGISEALITTETGLVVALPGLFFNYQLGRTRDYYAAFLAHLETVCTQDLYRRISESADAA